VISKAKIDKEQQGKMYFEFQLLKKLDHPHIIRIFEVFSDEKNFYLITEFCEGGEVFSMIQKSEVFNEKIAARVMKQIINAVFYCHTQGIVHRDIKSDNILFLYDKIDSPIKLIDFGISVRLEKDTKLKDKTGTVLYIAPEVIKGDYDEKCDIWSCGVLLYMMLSGSPPFYGKTRKEVINKILKGTVSFKQNIWGLVSSDAKDLITRMLEMNPFTRPSPLEVLSHPWFFKNKTSVKINSEVYLENMKKFEVGWAYLEPVSADAGDPDVHHNEHHPLRRDQGPAEPVPAAGHQQRRQAQQGGAGHR
jgi:calcium-dependent protein kinase